MSHPRKIIRDYVTRTLIDGNTLVGKNVFPNRKIHIDPDCGPHIVVHTESETVSLLDQAPRRYKRELILNLEIFARGLTEMDCQDRLDQIAWQVEYLLADDDDWNETVNHVDLTGVRFQFDENGANPLGVCILTYTAQYLTSIPDIADQKSANLTNLDAVQGLDGVGGSYGWDVVREDGTLDGSIDAELLIEVDHS